MRRLLLSLVVIALILPIEAGAATEKRSLRLGGTAFWTGPYTEDGSGDWTYLLDVAPGGKRLRIGLDHPEVDDGFS
ncbi:MAG: hypothetical protein H0U53_10825, partial [Actinobacteria bacterium]|nr:hypothetical protein [Actinomycetota bacterium]